MALPEFQRGYVWRRNQIRGFFDSLYRGHPVGGLLVWVTGSDSAPHRGDAELFPGMVNLLLDGQQRVTTVYSVARGKPPSFFDGNESLFSGLRFHLESEEFSFYQPVKMRDDPLWIDVTTVLSGGLGAVVGELDTSSPSFSMYMNRVLQLQNIMATDLYVEQIMGRDKSLDLVVDIFNRVNSGGTKLSKGDLALAKICSEWPAARQTMKQALTKWERQEYRFKLDWLLRSVNAILTGEAKFLYLHGKTSEEVQDALRRAEKAVDNVLNLIASRLGLDHDRVLFGRYAIPVMVRYLDQYGYPSTKALDKLAFWFLQAGMWGRFSGSTETVMDRNLEILATHPEPLDGLLEDLRLWHGDLQVEPGHFNRWSRGSSFYPVIYMLTRRGGSKDWGTGLPLKHGLVAKMNQLDMHHIFPKSRLYKKGYSRIQVNSLANFCFLTHDTNLRIGNRLPEDYFPQIEEKHPGALRSQWIPEDEALWKIENYPEFLEARRVLLAASTNRIFEELLHGDTKYLGPKRTPDPVTITPTSTPGGIADADEEAEIRTLNDWVSEQGLPAGQVEFELTSPDTGQALALFDLAWPDGLQTGLSQPVALLLNEDATTLAIAMSSEFRCFTKSEDFRRYVTTEINPTDSGSESRSP